MKRMIVFAGIGGLLTWPGSSCMDELRLRSVAVHMDRVAKSIDEYGFASVSAPFLAVPNDDFRFRLDKPASDFFDMAFKPQGSARNFSSEALDIQVAIRMNVEQAISSLAQLNQARSIAQFRESQRRVAMQHGLLSSLAKSNPQFGENPLVQSTLGMLEVAKEQPEPSQEALPGFTPTSQPVELGPPFKMDHRVALGGVGNSFTPGLAIPEGPFQISAREALLIASGDSLTQSLLQWFTRPRGNKLAHYELFFCPMTVSVQPGTITRKGYIADITVDVDLARDCGQNKLEYLSENFPHSSPPIHVAGVFPVMDGQILELANSRRQLFSAAFQLSMLGFGTQADAFLDYAKKLEADARTQTMLTVGSAYTVSSTTFGFRVEPKFVASVNPSSLETSPGEILESKTFPAMAVVLVHRSYLNHEKKDSNAHDTPIFGDTSPANVARAHRTALDPSKNDPRKYDYLVFRTSTRWSPGGRSNGRSGNVRFAELEGWERAKAIDSAERELSQPAKDCKSADSNRSETQTKCSNSLRQRDHLGSRLIALRKMALDSQTLMRVWHTMPRDNICISDYYPRHGWQDQATVITIRGKGFNRNVDSVTVGGIYCTYRVLSDETMLVLVPAWNSAKQIESDESKKFIEVVEASKAHSNPIPGESALNGGLSDSGFWARTNGNGEGSGGQDSKQEIHPLTEHEMKMMEELGAMIARCQINKTDNADKWEEYQSLKKKHVDFENASRSDRAKKAKERADEAAKNASMAARAEIVIGARVHVCWRKGGCSTDTQVPCGFEDQFPAKPTKDEASEAAFGWIIFDKSLPAKEKGPPSGGELEILRDKEGRIIGIKTGDGGFSNGVALLQLIQSALAGSNSVDVEFSTDAGARLRTKKSTE